MHSNNSSTLQQTVDALTPAMLTAAAQILTRSEDWVWKPDQLQLVAKILRRSEDMLIIQPTGWGKTLLWLLPTFIENQFLKTALQLALDSDSKSTNAGDLDNYSSTEGFQTLVSSSSTASTPMCRPLATSSASFTASSSVSSFSASVSSSSSRSSPAIATGIPLSSPMTGSLPWSATNPTTQTGDGQTYCVCVRCRE